MSAAAIHCALFAPAESCGSDSEPFHDFLRDPTRETTREMASWSIQVPGVAVGPEFSPTRPLYRPKGPNLEGTPHGHETFMDADDTCGCLWTQFFLVAKAIIEKRNQWNQWNAALSRAVKILGTDLFSAAKT